MELLFVGNNEQLEKALWLADNSGSLRKVVCLFPAPPGQKDPRYIHWDDFIELGKKDSYKVQLEQILQEAEADDLATIIYTSGTTGEPKGVMLGQDNFICCFKIHDKRLEVTDKDVSLCFLPLSHIFERSWTFYMLHRGAVNVFLENPKAIMEELSLARPSLMCTVPRFYEKTYEGIKKEEGNWAPIKRKLFDWAMKTGQVRADFLKSNRKPPIALAYKYAIADKLVLKKLRSVFGGNIRTMPCSGAAIRPELLRFFHAAGLFVNYGYGATETTATVSCFRTEVYDFESSGTVMPEIDVKITDKGEILVKGATVFKGYFNKPEETARVLENGWYHTGDKGRITSEGNLVMEDRINDIFKTSGGKYISPQKIELLLCNDPFLEQAVVLGDNQKYMTALIVPSFTAIRSKFGTSTSKSPDNHSLINDSEIITFFRNRLELIQEELPPYEKVVKFTLLPEPFRIENDTLTITLKMRRKAINSKYREFIDDMYLPR
jgi:long-chain acyl-CoA synthetase